MVRSLNKSTTMTTTRIDELKELGFSLEILSGPTPSVKDNWQSIAYNIRLLFNGKPIIETPYNLGIGHVKVKDFKPSFTQGWTTEEESILRSWQNKPYANFIDKALQARVAAKLAKIKKVVPQLDDVLYGLLSDGEAYFSGQTFEDWAIELGYDPDSRKAETIWKQCDLTGRKLSQLSSDTLAKVREILEDL